MPFLDSTMVKGDNQACATANHYKAVRWVRRDFAMEKVEEDITIFGTPSSNKALYDTKALLMVFFQLQKSRPRLFVAAAAQLSRSARRIATDVSTPRNMINLWTSLDWDVLRLFSDYGPEADFLPRCAVTSCGRAWSIEGIPKVCSGCHAKHYCSKGCQKAYVCSISTVAISPLTHSIFFK